MFITPLSVNFKPHFKCSSAQKPQETTYYFNETFAGTAELTDEQINTINQTKVAPDDMSFIPYQKVKQTYARQSHVEWGNTGKYAILHDSTIKQSTNKALDKMKSKFLPEGYKVVKEKSGKAFAVKIQDRPTK